MAELVIKTSSGILDGETLILSLPNMISNSLEWEITKLSWVIARFPYSIAVGTSDLIEIRVPNGVREIKGLPGGDFSISQWGWTVGSFF